MSQSVIASHTKVIGDITGAGDLAILGTCKGDLHLKGRVSVQGPGILKGNVYAQEIEVQGVVIGELRAELSIILGPNARVVGSLTAPSIEVLQGAQFQGPVKSQAPERPALQSMRADPVKQEPQSKARLAREKRSRPSAEITMVTHHQDLP